MENLEPTLGQLLTFAAIVTRMSGLVATAPLLGDNYAPQQVKVLLTVTLSLLLTPMFWDTPFQEPGNTINLVVVMAGELAIGVSLGMGIKILFTGVQITGQLLGQIGGLSVADVFNPAFDENVPLLAIIFDMVVVAVFLAIGGHRLAIGALLASYQTLPPGVGTLDANVVYVIRDTLTYSFILGVQAAAPGMVALLIGVLVLGLISRTLPQLNLIAIGFSLNSMLLLIFVMLTIGSIAWMFQSGIESTVDKIQTTFIARPGDAELPLVPDFLDAR